jgi:hypothetical protein
MKQETKIIALIVTLSLSSCASPGGRTLMSTVIGMVVGGAVGAIVDGGATGKNRPQNIFAGSTIGAGVGVATGCTIEQLVQHETDPLKKSLEIKQSNIGSDNFPAVSNTRIEGRFIDDQINGSKFEPGHFEYEIKEAPKWIK